MCLQLGALVAAPLHSPVWPWSPPLTAPSGGFLGAPRVPHPAVGTSIPLHSSSWVPLAHTERFSWGFLQVSSAYILPALALNLMSPRSPSGAEHCLGRGTQGLSQLVEHDPSWRIQQRCDRCRTRVGMLHRGEARAQAHGAHVEGLV